jgi:hypothetical protein
VKADRHSRGLSTVVSLYGGVCGEMNLMAERAHEKRRRRRIPTRRAALIKWGDSPSSVRCVLWDQSEDGARIAAPYASKLPPVFTLFSDNKASNVCRIVWRKGPLIGVQFVEATEREELARVRAAKPQQTEPSQPLPDNIRLSLGAHAVRGSIEHKDVPISSLALVFLLVLIALTILFYFAGQESGSGSAWAVGVCREAGAMCEHPEFGGGASVLMAVVYFAARGMEL